MDTKLKENSLHVSISLYNITLMLQFWNRILIIYNYYSPKNISIPWKQIRDTAKMASLLHYFCWPSRRYHYEISK